MKIALPVNENNEQTTICLSFGRTPYYLITDTESEMKDYMENKAASQPGGAGIAAAQSLVDANIESVLSPSCGENAAKVLQAGGIKIYKTQGVSVDENIRAFAEGKLSSLDDIHPGFHGHGGQK